MTALNNTNDDDEHSTSPTPGGNTGSVDDEAWAQFAQAHAEDFRAIERSKDAKQFSKQAARQEKEALLSVHDLKEDSFTAHARGPRDFTGSSWLDTDNVMDRYGDDFVPPHPSFGKPRFSLLLCWVLFLIGVFGIIASTLLPAAIGVLGTVFGLCLLIGGAGLLAQLRGFHDTRTDPDDDGARV